MANFATHFYFSPRGRTGRRLYWMFGIVPLWVAGIILGVLARVIRLPQEALFLLMAAFALVGLWAWVCIGSRRLHDFNQSAWWMLLAIAFPIGISLVTPAWVTQLITIVVTTILGAIPGTAGSNSFGADPSARFSRQVS